LSDTGEFVSLKEFDGGTGWDARVHSDGLRFIKVFEQLSGEKLKEVVRAVGGEIVDRKLYESVAWSVKVRPLPYLEVLMVLSLDPEFGNDFFTYYSRSALGKVPTEDIIVYSWVFAALLAKEGKRVLNEQEFSSEKLEMAEAPIEERLRVLKYIDPATAKTVADAIGGKSKTFEGSSWAIEKEPVPGFKITYLLRGQNGEVIFDKGMLQKFIHFENFLWLYCNAIIRESRKILGDKIPRLSASGIL
jgi:hypothetical protein